MPRTHDLARVRAILERDRGWSVYALGDVPFPERCEWRCLDDRDGTLILLYRAFEDPILFATGPPDEVGPLLDEIGAGAGAHDGPPPPRLYLHVRPEHLVPIEARRHVEGVRRMWRMVLGTLAPAGGEGTRPLGASDLASLRALYAGGRDQGEEPEFFIPSMLEGGAYHGLWEKGELVAAAGTHVVSAETGIAGLGNVYVRRDRRGRGLGTIVTRAVCVELGERGIPTIALNVNEENHAAIQVYERLGFQCHCRFIEGISTRRDR